VHTGIAHVQWAAAPRLRAPALGCAIAWLASGCFHPSYDRPICGPQRECPAVTSSRDGAAML
jgi:hypothetical protein